MNSERQKWLDRIHRALEELKDTPPTGTVDRAARNADERGSSTGKVK